MKKVKEFTPDEVQDFILLCLRTNWTSLPYAKQMQADLNAAIAKQKAEKAEEEVANLPWKASDMYKNGEHPERFHGG